MRKPKGFVLKSVHDLLAADPNYARFVENMPVWPPTASAGRSSASRAAPVWDKTLSGLGNAAVAQGVRPADPRGVADALPEPARQKFLLLADLADEQAVLSRSATDELMEFQLQLQRAQQRVDELTDKHTASRSGLSIVHDASHPSVAAAHSEVQRISAALERLRDLQTQRSSRRTRTATLVENLARFVASAPVAVFQEPVRLKKGATLAAVREEREVLLTELKAVQNAPISAAEAQARIRADVEALAEQGAPDLSALARGGGISWPKRTTHDKLYGHTVVPDHGPVDITGFAQNSSVDAHAVLVWLVRDELIEALSDQVADLAGLGPEDRAARIADLSAALLSNERVEEVLVEQAGDPMLRRPDADPRAVLGLV